MDKIMCVYLNKNKSDFVKDEYAIPHGVVIEIEQPDWDYLKNVRGMHQVYGVKLANVKRLNKVKK